MFGQIGTKSGTDVFNFGNEYERKSMIRHSKWDALTIFYIPSKLIFQFHLHAQNPDGQVSYYDQTNEKAPLRALCRNIQVFCILFKDLTRHNHLKKGLKK